MLLKWGFKNSTFYLESVVLESRSSIKACLSERSLRYFNLGRISDLFSIHRSSSHTMLAAEKIQGSLVVRKQVLWESLKYGRLKNTGSCPKLSSAIETVWSLNFRASTPTLYVKNKMAEASLLPPPKIFSFSAVVGCLF